MLEQLGQKIVVEAVDHHTHASRILNGELIVHSPLVGEPRILASTETRHILVEVCGMQGAVAADVPRCQQVNGRVLPTGREVLDAAREAGLRKLSHACPYHSATSVLNRRWMYPAASTASLTVEG